MMQSAGCPAHTLHISPETDGKKQYGRQGNAMKRNIWAPTSDQTVERKPDNQEARQKGINRPGRDIISA